MNRSQSKNCRIGNYEIKKRFFFALFFFFFFFFFLTCFDDKIYILDNKTDALALGY